ncbi:MAG TPA: hypothetical protein VLE97_06125 [Gaiellaceae bacterium]|nr:hypothetical protein [Gaiellaceae bacterium]
MSLFPASTTKRTAKVADRAAPVRIPTGAPRLVESASARRGRSRQVAWDDLLAAVRRSSLARLELYRGRSPSDRVPCPWERLTACGGDCRCGGAGTVMVAFLCRHYENLVVNIVLAAGPSRSGRAS